MFYALCLAQIGMPLCAAYRPIIENAAVTRSTSVCQVCLSIDRPPDSAYLCERWGCDAGCRARPHTPSLSYQDRDMITSKLLARAVVSQELTCRLRSVTRLDARAWCTDARVAAAVMRPGPYVAVTGCREASEREFDRDSRPAMAFRDLRGPMSDRAEWAAAGWTTASCVVCSARERRVPLRSIRADLIGSQLQVIVDALTAMHCPTDRGDGKGSVRHRFTNVWWISVIIHLLYVTVEACPTASTSALRDLRSAVVGTARRRRSIWPAA